MTTTVHATVFQAPLNPGELDLRPLAILVTDGQHLTVVGNSNTAQGLGSLARERFTPASDPEEALGRFCDRALSSYEALSDPIRSEASLKDVVSRPWFQPVSATVGRGGGGVR